MSEMVYMCTFFQTTTVWSSSSSSSQTQESMSEGLSLHSKHDPSVYRLLQARQPATFNTPRPTSAPAPAPTRMQPQHKDWHTGTAMCMPRVGPAVSTGLSRSPWQIPTMYMFTHVCNTHNAYSAGWLCVNSVIDLDGSGTADSSRPAAHNASRRNSKRKRNARAAACLRGDSRRQARITPAPTAQAMIAQIAAAAIRILCRSVELSLPPCP